MGGSALKYWYSPVKKYEGAIYDANDDIWLVNDSQNNSVISELFKVEDEILSIAAEELNVADIELFPNPAKDHVTIQWDSQLSLIVAVYDAAGRLVGNPVEKTGECQLNTSNWDTGIYSVVLSDQQGNRVNKRMVILP